LKCILAFVSQSLRMKAYVCCIIIWGTYLPTYIPSQPHRTIVRMAVNQMDEVMPKCTLCEPRAYASQVYIYFMDGSVEHDDDNDGRWAAIESAWWIAVAAVYSLALRNSVRKQKKHLTFWRDVWWNRSLTNLCR
jgi:hypothetical protein